MRDHLAELGKEKIISEMETPFVSPAFMIRKKNGKIRLVVNYRELNRCTKPIQISFPKLSDILQTLNGSRYFTTLDLNQGYYQVPIRKLDIPKTGFRICGKTYVFNRMPFGLANAPRTFTKIMMKILGDLEFVKIYMDDILIHSESEASHYEHLKIVLERLLNAGASINFEKSNIKKTEIRFLSHIINHEGIKADITNIKEFKIPIPKTKKKLQKLLEYLNWFRPFVYNYAQHVAELYQKLGNKNEKITWTEKDSENLNKLVEKIKSNKILAHPDLNEEFTLEVDASKTGIGATLYQKNKIIGHFSTIFKKSELNYTISEKETYAILKALDHFRQLVLGSKITIRTDHSNNLFDKELTKRQQRWKLLLQEFDYQLEHIKGRDNISVDTLSRNDLTPRCLNIASNTNCVNSIPVNEERSKKIPNLNSIEEFQKLTSEIKQLISNDTPSQFVTSKIKELHEHLTHSGYSKFKKTLSDVIDIRKIQRQIKNVCSFCRVCQFEKETHKRTPKVNYLTQIPELYEQIMIDIKGPIKCNHFKTGRKNNVFYILAISECLRRYTEIAILHEINSFTVCEAIKKKWLDRHEIPNRCVTDNGRQFTSSI
ncbi:Transposon Ty3-G Gag-Pol polyprotein, partial [Dictyocoela roeselum]